MTMFDTEEDERPAFQYRPGPATTFARTFDAQTMTWRANPTGQTYSYDYLGDILPYKMNGRDIDWVVNTLEPIMRKHANS